MDEARLLLSRAVTMSALSAESAGLPQLTVTPDFSFTLIALAVGCGEHRDLPAQSAGDRRRDRTYLLQQRPVGGVRLGQQHTARHRPALGERNTLGVHEDEAARLPDREHRTPLRDGHRDRVRPGPGDRAARTAGSVVARRAMASTSCRASGIPIGTCGGVR